MPVSFLVTFVVTRLIRAATAEFAYRPGPPAQQVEAVIFAAGAALTLDEFALWLYLEDVYWTAEARRSVGAVLVAAMIGILFVPLVAMIGAPARQAQLPAGAPAVRGGRHPHRPSSGKRGLTG
ncbi:hypothetical protein ABZV93_15995 [Actinopolymorpha sp. NPDC004070]|uniref:hypothetical protein n=1 Tax=Actinopolymorpha sp. NPDC004070 TaxID=3154548 RepID=UPI0033A1F88B